MLKIDNISVSYGQVKALLGVSIEVNDGEIVSIIGSNGAGKSSLMRSIVGDVKVQSGKIYDGDTDLTAMKTHEIVKRGVVYVPEGRQVFAKLSVLENLKWEHSASHIPEQNFRNITMKCLSCSHFEEKRSQLAGSLSGGQQQMLALCRGLMCDPKIILLDEPSLGLAPVIVDEVFDKIREINEKKVFPSFL